MKLFSAMKPCLNNMSAAKCYKAITITRWLLFIIILEKTTINICWFCFLAKGNIYNVYSEFLHAFFGYASLFFGGCWELLILAIDPNVTAMTVMYDLYLVLSSSESNA